MPRVTYPFEGTGSDHDNIDLNRDEVMIAMQIEALGVRRRENITTTDFKENKAAFVSSDDLQSSRLINQQGTAESELARKASKQISAWNGEWLIALASENPLTKPPGAFAFLQDDGTAEPGLRDVNEGLGQTHRGKLQADDSVRHYAGEPGYDRGGRGGRDGRGSARGGGITGQGSGRCAFKERSPAVTRTRVVKGQSVNLGPSANAKSDVKLPTVPQPPVKHECPDLQATRQFMKAVGETSKRGGRYINNSTASPQGSSKRVLDPKSAEDSMATPSRNTRPSISYALKLVSPASFMAGVRDCSASQSTSSSLAQQQAGYNSALSVDKVGSSAVSSTVEISIVTSPKEISTSARKPSTPGEDIARPMKVTQTWGPDLMDLELGQEPSNQPFLSFTQPQKQTVSQATAAMEPNTPVIDVAKHLCALEVCGLLTKEQLNMLRTIRLIQDADKANVPAEPKIESEPTELTSMTAEDEPHNPGKYTAAELVALRSITPVTSTLEAVVTSPTRPQGTQGLNPFGARVIQLQAYNLRESCRSLALQLAEQKRAMIGDHIHHSAFQPHASIVKGCRKLTFSDKPPSDVSETLTESTTAESIEAARKEREVFECSRSNPFGLAKKKAGLSLPPHLCDQKPAADHGAAVRAQYGLGDALAFVPNDLQNKLPIAKAAALSLPPLLRSGSPSDSGATARALYRDCEVPARTSMVQPHGHVTVQITMPSLPARLRDQTTNDTAAAARAQCGGIEIAARPLEVHPQSQVLIESIKLSLPAHLHRKTNNGTGDADVPTSIHNSSQLRSPTFTGATGPTTAVSQATAHASRFNQSGFTGLAARAREA